MLLSRMISTVVRGSKTPSKYHYRRVLVLSLNLALCMTCCSKKSSSIETMREPEGTPLVKVIAIFRDWDIPLGLYAVRVNV